MSFCPLGELTELLQSLTWISGATSRRGKGEGKGGREKERKERYGRDGGNSHKINSWLQPSSGLVILLVLLSPGDRVVISRIK